MLLANLDPDRLTEHVHGHLGWLAAAMLLHPAIVLRSRARRAHLAVGLATAFVTFAAGLGAWLYVAYRAQLKASIFREAPAVGLLFERKEHLAFGAVVFAWAGCAAYVGALRAAPRVREPLRTAAFRCFCISAGLALLTAALGTYVATFRSF